MAKESQAQRRAVVKYHAEKMDQISIRVKKTDGFPAMIDRAAAALGIPRARWIRRAIEEKLQTQGINPEDTQKLH